ncbi:MAG: DNA repair protein RecN [Syntrophales bacterium]|jgi:DNA repair protein RecN (Recombination protein N)|nr:DNA repair protein RecN [Syntrophales bacterium]MDY0044401.1 DNA repair protein RecN [Syntrophales bacterium]
MLAELTIRNLAIIDALTIEFREGLTVISGETGAGKSIIIGALSMLLGDRVSNDMIRTSEESAVVEGRFEIEGNSEVEETLAEMGLDKAQDLVIRRIISRSGKNRVYINGSPATVQMLSAVGECLVNICGQHEHQTLLRTDRHIDILDEFGGLLNLRNEYLLEYRQFLEFVERREELLKANDERHDREKLLSFQLEEIEKSDVRKGEDEALKEEKKILASASKLREYGESSYADLYGNEGSILEKLDSIRERTGQIKAIDQGFSVTGQEMDAAFFALEDIAFALRDYVKNIPDDPSRLEQIDDRIELIGKLKRKYGSTIEEVLERKEAIKKELGEITRLEEEIECVEAIISEKKTRLLRTARHLSDMRKHYAHILEEKIEGEIHDLHMIHTVFRIMFAEASESEDSLVLHENGLDRVEFYLSTNVGETLKPLQRIASGGELSRIVLAIKKVAATGGSAGTVVFDEVDSGIGGAAAERIGSKLKDVSLSHQVICITHLPQIACFGDAHYLVTKKVSDGRTHTRVLPLAEPERLEEIARMLGGIETTETTRRHAMEMLAASKGD